MSRTSHGARSADGVAADRADASDKAWISAGLVTRGSSWDATLLPLDIAVRNLEKTRNKKGEGIYHRRGLKAPIEN